MQPNVENDPTTRELDVNDDQYRRPSCGRHVEIQVEKQDLGPGTTQMLHLLNVMGI